MLRIEQARVRLGDRVILDDVDLDVGASETVAVLGPSGSGKTTLLRAIAGLQPLDAGRVTWDGADLAAVAPHTRQFGLVFQEYALFPHRDVSGNVEFGLRMHGLDREARAARVDEVLALVGLTEQRHQRVASLSGGEQQRVALARALAVSPRLLMLDEPLGALDRVWRTRLLGEIRELLDRASLPAVYVTHDHDEALTIAERVAIMRDGKIVQVDTPAAVWRQPVDAWTATFLGFGPRVAAEVRRGRLRTPWGELDVSADTLDGAREIVVRPDAVHLDPTGPFVATVARVTFAGTAIEVALQPGVGPGLTCRVDARAAPAVGAGVCFTLHGDGVLQYPRAAD